MNCVRAWHTTHFNKKFKFPFASLRVHFEKIFKTSDSVKNYPKIFKGLLCDYFSMITKQERPQVPVSGENLFPSRYSKRVWREISKTNKGLVATAWDLMQTKSLAAEVDESFVKETLLKHRATVTKITTTAPATLHEFQEFVRPWAKAVARVQMRGEFPNSHSSYELARSKGGVRGNYEIVNTAHIQPDQPRLDPTSLLISGLAGSGKSLFQTQLSRRLAKFLKQDSSMTSYSRNSSTKHWDGYTNQPMCLIDDFLQKNVKNAEDVVEHNEFIAINSTVDYCVPMAHLSAKGRLFTSPLITFSTNKSLENCVRTLRLTQSDELAIRRRFTFLIQRSPAGDGYEFARLSSTPLVENSTTQFKTERTILHKGPSLVGLVEPVFTALMCEWNRKSIFYQQNLEDCPSLPVGMNQMLKCNVSDEHNKVKVIPLVEPLKVRTITVGTAKNFLLKSLQSEMLKQLRPYKAFKPCFTPEYDDEIARLYERPGTWLSGDYSQATDGLHSDLFQAGIQTLTEELQLAGQPDWLVELTLRESGAHICEYPKKFDIPDALQTNGQLMGSLLSFPFLCLANAFTVAKVEGHLNLEKIDSALIHGDDLLWRTDAGSIAKWKQFCPTIGLGLSMGKNYVDQDWGSIDSQVFYFGKRLQTGKYSCYLADDAQKVETLLRKGLPKALVVSLAKDFLTKTPRSIDVSTDFGGLGVTGEPCTNRARIICNSKVRKSVGRIAKVSNGYTVMLPKLFLPKTFDRVLDFEIETKDEEFRWSKLHRLEKMYPAVPLCSFPVTEMRTVFIPSKDRMLELLLDNLQEHYCPLKDDSK